MLKSWSQHGGIEYANFGYPKPRQFPFDKPLSEQAGVSRLTFNWNTRGVGYVTDEAPFEVLAFTPTGSLPVDYLGDKDARLREFEETAYTYFAGMSYPNLVRVVQYTRDLSNLEALRRHSGLRAEHTAARRGQGAGANARGVPREHTRRRCEGDARARSSKPSHRAHRRVRGGAVETQARSRYE